MRPPSFADINVNLVSEFILKMATSAVLAHEISPSYNSNQAIVQLRRKIMFLQYS